MRPNQIWKLIIWWLIIITIIFAVHSHVAMGPFPNYRETYNYIKIRHWNESYSYYHNDYSLKGLEVLRVTPEDTNVSRGYCKDIIRIEDTGLISGKLCKGSPTVEVNVNFDELPKVYKDKLEHFRSLARKKWPDFDRLLEER